ncbi:Retrovirus-related Pol polyprotein from transposon 17.6, partial [Mucuna pruriens]
MADVDSIFELLLIGLHLLGLLGVKLGLIWFGRDGVGLGRDDFFSAESSYDGPENISVEPARKEERFIKNFSKIALPLSKLLQKNVDFVYDEACVEAFEELKTRLTSTPILQAQNWELPIELMCDASNSALGVVLGQRVEVGKLAYVISYTSQTMELAHINYITTEKELLAIVFPLDKFRAYLLGSKVIVFSNHVALKYLVKKLDAKPRLIRWMLLLQKFNLEFKDKKGAFRMSSSSQCSISATPLLEAAIMGQLGLLGRSLIVASIGLPFTETQINSSRPVSNVNESGWQSAEGMKCLNNQWVEAIATRTNDAKMIVDFLKFGVPKALINDQGTHFYNRVMSSLCDKYGVIHKNRYSISPSDQRPS